MNVKVLTEAVKFQTMVVVTQGQVAAWTCKCPQRKAFPTVKCAHIVECIAAGM